MGLMAYTLNMGVVADPAQQPCRAWKPCHMPPFADLFSFGCVLFWGSHVWLALKELQKDNHQFGGSKVKKRRIYSILLRAFMLATRCSYLALWPKSLEPMPTPRVARVFVSSQSFLSLSEHLVAWLVAWKEGSHLFVSSTTKSKHRLEVR